MQQSYATETMRRPAEQVRSLTSLSFPVYFVGDGVMLAGQPKPSEWRLLAQQYHTVINIRSDPARAEVQRGVIEAAGMQQIYLPLPRELEAEHLQAFAEMVERGQADGLIVHCRTASRTALIWMLYRLLYHNWSEEQARDELLQAGYEAERIAHFTLFVRQYMQHMAKEFAVGSG